jgi:hypothetical protein
MSQCANLCALHKFSLTLAEISPENGESGKPRVCFCVFQEPYPIESAEFFTSLPLLRTSDDNHRDHTGAVQWRRGIRQPGQPGGHYAWLRTVRYDADAHGAAARRKRPGDSSSRLTARTGNGKAPAAGWARSSRQLTLRTQKIGNGRRAVARPLKISRMPQRKALDAIAPPALRDWPPAVAGRQRHAISAPR